MTLLQTLIPAACLVIGYFLESIVQAMNRKRRKKECYSKALSFLLHIHLRSKYLDTYTKAFIETLEIDTDLYPYLRNIFELFYPDMDDLTKEYNTVVSEISEAEAILGIQLQSKAHVFGLLSTLRSLVADTPDGGRIIQLFEQTVYSGLIRALEEDIATLSNYIGGDTKKNVNSYLARDVTLPAEIDEYLRGLATL